MKIHKHAFKKTVVARALVMAFGFGVGSFGLVQDVFAQSNATGSIYGKVESPSGASIQIQNTDTGLKRTITLDAAGRYNVTALPAGHYKVEMLRDGKVIGAQDFDMVIGQGTEASFSGATVQQVTVSATRTKIDVSNTNNGAIFTAKELSKLPVQANMTAVALLAPNTTKGDPAYGNVASFGGGGVSENAYYINGFPITNPLSQIGASQLPWGSVAQTSVITGGFGAEFGRSIGGVMNMTTKSGTNNWEVGASYSTAPDGWRGVQKDIMYPYNGTSTNRDGHTRFRQSLNQASASQYGFTLGGPLIEDKLFMFVAVEKNLQHAQGVPFDVETTAASTLAQNGWRKVDNEATRYVAKVDWNLNDDHRIEWTSIGDKNKQDVSRYGFSNVTGRPNNVLYSETNETNAIGLGATAGAASNIFKYTGQLTPALTLTTLVGQSKSPRGVTYSGTDANTSTVHSVALDPSFGDPKVAAFKDNYLSSNRYGGTLSRPGEDKITTFRFDLEYKLGDHTLRAGIDSNQLESGKVGVKSSGNGLWTYARGGPIGADFTKPVDVSFGDQKILANYGGFGPQGYYVQEFVFNSLTEAKSSQSAQYFEDRYQVTKNFLLVAGLRNDQYSNTNGDGEKFINMKNQLAPRLSASWDVNGDSSMKVFGSAGRYYLQLPTRVSARAASRSTFTWQDFTYTGVDANGQPLGLNPMNIPTSPDGESGTRKDPRSIAARDLKPNFQDEMTLGFERAMSPELNIGAKFTYRKLGAGIDDNCDTRIIAAYSKSVGLKQEGDPLAYLSCWIFNPGSDSTIWVESHDALGNTTGNGRYVTFKAADMKFPKATRTYSAVDLFAEHPYRNGWYGKVNYTWSRSAGNMEGQTNSDTGQQDVATTANWDFPEFMTFANGVLPNDRTHQLKAFGYIELSSQWNLGANLLVQSGRPKTCLGKDPIQAAGKDPSFPLEAEWGGPQYGNAWQYCFGAGAPRGSLGRMPVQKQLDLSLTYKPSYAPGIVVGLDVFNVFNDQVMLTRDEVYGTGTAIRSSYGAVSSYAQPVSARLRLEYNKKF